MAAAKPRLGARIGIARSLAGTKTTAKGNAKNGAPKNGSAKNVKNAKNSSTAKNAKNGAASNADNANNADDANKVDDATRSPAPARATRAAAPARAKSGADAARPVGSGTPARRASATRASATRANAARGNASRANAARASTGGAGGYADPEPADVRYEYPAAWLRWATFALTLIGLGVSVYLTYAHYTESALAGCTETTGVVNCAKVTTSPQSVVFGIPVAVLGLAFYVFAVAIMSPWAWKVRRREVGMLRLASVIVGIGFVLYLIYAELFDIGSICLYCTSVHVITFFLFVLTGLAVAVWGFSPRAQVAPRQPAR